MDFRFGSNSMRRAYESSSVALREWGEAAGKAYIARVNQIKHSKTLADLSAGSSKFEALSGDRKDQYSFRLTKGMRLIMTLEDNGATVVIHEVSDHYES